MTNLNNNASISARNTFPLDDRVQESTESDYRLGTSEPKSGEGNALTQEEKLVGKTLKKNVQLTAEELAAVNTKKGLLQLLLTKNVNVKKALVKLRYEQELEKLQIELVKLQRSIQIEGRRVGIIFEGRDAAGKGGSIRRFIEHLNPRSARVVA